MSTNATSGNVDSPVFRTLTMFFYILIFTVSTLGNGFVFMVVLYRQRLQTVMNYFLVNLAAADLTLTVICIPFDLYVQESGAAWPYGRVFCKVLYPLQTMSLYASVFTLCAISFSRHRAIVHPLKKQFTVYITKCLLVCIWGASLMAVVPYMMVLMVDDEQRCVEKWPEPASSYRYSYTLFICITMYFAPVTIIMWAYLRIWVALRTEGVPAQGQPNHASENARVLKMAVCISVAFALCLLPNQVTYLVLDVYFDGQYQIHREWIIIGNLMVFLNTALDPIVYTVFNEKYRDEFRKFIKCKICKRKEEARLEAGLVSLQSKRQHATTYITELTTTV